MLASGCQEDTSSLKHGCIFYIIRDPTMMAVSPPITRDHLKSFRGFNHPAIAQLLCPINLLEDFDTAPKFDFIIIIQDLHSPF